MDICFANEKPYVSCIKSLIGHTLGASGAIEGIAVIIALKKQILLPIFGLYNCEYEIPHADFMEKSNYEKVLHIYTELEVNLTGLLYRKHQ